MAADYITKDTYTGRHTTALRKGFRVTVWTARELAELAPEGVIFESFGTVGGIEKFGRSRYQADSDGNLHLYDSDGAKKIVHPASRKLRIITK